MLRTDVTPKFKGACISWPLHRDEVETFPVEIEANDDAILLIRCNDLETKVSYSMHDYQRSYNNAELIDMTRKLAVKKHFDEEQQASMRLLYQNYAVVFYFENNNSKTLNVNVEMTAMNNLKF